MYIFGFGSLVNINSAQKSFKRKLQESDFIEVCLKGYKKCWNSIEYIKFENEENITNGIFLNLCKDETSQTIGIVLKIDEEEFENLKLREKNYSCIELVNSSIEGIDTKEKIYTFITTNPEKLANKEDENSYICRRYIKLLEDAVNVYSKDFQEKFKKSYENYTYPIKDGDYIFVDPIQNKFAREGICEK